MDGGNVTKNLMVSEIYAAPQWEGPALGLPSIFLRTQFCPVGCSWCDSRHTWNFDRNAEMTDAAIVAELEKYDPISHVIFTGGEPFAQAEAVERITNRLVNEGYTIDFETSGTYMPLRTMSDMCVNYVCSPKPPSAETKVPYNDQAIEFLIERGAHFKFVIKDQSDLDWAGSFMRKYAIPQNRMVLMPEGMTPEAVIAGMIWLEQVGPKQYPQARLTPRMHIIMHGQKRRT
jgi:7-carboxy-7-deazaguanine synthase